MLLSTGSGFKHAGGRISRQRISRRAAETLRFVLILCGFAPWRAFGGEGHKLESNLLRGIFCLITADFWIDLRRIGFNAPIQVQHIVIALRNQPIGELCAADAVMAHDDQRLIR